MVKNEIASIARYLCLVPTEDGEHLAWTRYGNANGFAWAFVAVLQFHKSYLVDWAAYLGGCDLTQHETDAVCWIARHGNKVSAEDAHHFFPTLPIDLYRP